ncbi:MAG: flagellar protein FlgN [Clostridiales bacterium]|nr:flagellar protein FlgN [Clostridiales bacterium]
MAGLMEQLLDVLSNQAEIYDVLIDLSEKKKAVIIENSAEGLQKITSEENSYIGKVQKLDKVRVATMKEIGIVLNIKDKDYTLTHLCELVKNQPDYERLSNLIGETRSKLEQLRQINDQNKNLIENSLDYIEYSVNVLRSSLEPEKRFYDSSGSEIGQSTGFFDAKQ